MKLRSKSHIFAITLCVIALFVMKASGTEVAYYCLCGGTPVATQTSHCHGPHGERCHSDKTQNSDAHSEEGEGQREDHKVVSKDTPLRLVDTAPPLSAPEMLLTPPLLEIIFSAPTSNSPVVYAVDLGHSPPFGVTVARTIVLLI